MAVAVTNTSVTAFNTLGVITKNPATSSVANEAEVFTITRTKAMSDMTLIMNNTSGSNGTVTYSIAVGVGVFASPDVSTGSVAQGVLSTIKLDAEFTSATGTIVITFTPANGKKLLTDHAFSVYAIESV